MSSLLSQIPQDWRSTLTPHAMEALERVERFLESEPAFLPAREKLFSSLHLTPLERVRAVILGQDPYPTPGHANGLAFSVERGVKPPRSLQNMFKALALDLGLAAPQHGDLSAWAERGVLLLNTVLSVRPHEAMSHRKQGWEHVTECWLQAVNSKPEPVVFFCFGKPAQALVEKWIDSARHLVLKTPHPSPLTQGAFLRAVESEAPFKQARDFLSAQGFAPLSWELS